MTASTVAVAASAAHQIPKGYEMGFAGLRFTVSMATTSLDDVGDIVELGYLPANCTVVGFIVSSTDMDTNASPTATGKLTLGSTDVVTGIADQKAGTSTFYACSPQALTAVTKLQWNQTAVSATAAAGTLDVTALYINQ
jgi:hypothetical protein